jgi:hypothetical protein
MLAKLFILFQVICIYTECPSESSHLVMPTMDGTPLRSGVPLVSCVLVSDTIAEPEVPGRAGLRWLLMILMAF